MSGLIHLYCGDGKGKTTAAMGLSLRALGSGMQVVIVQFLKGRTSGEAELLSRMPGVTLLRGKQGLKFSFQMNDEERAATALVHNEHLREAIRLANEGQCDLLVLDEAVAAYNLNLLDQALLEQFVKEKPDELELVLTGRNPPQWMIDAADYVTELCKRKHPFDWGIAARKGIEL